MFTVIFQQKSIFLKRISFYIIICKIYDRVDMVGKTNVCFFIRRFLHYKPA